jgi:hypothetical protein
LDQINVVIPQGVSGCNLGVIVQTGNFVSNPGTISVASSGRTCSDQATTGLSPAEMQQLLNKGTVRIGVITVGKSTTQTPDISFGGVTIPGSTSTGDFASAGFSEFTAAQVNATGGISIQQTSLGSCTAYQYKGTAGSIPEITQPKDLDAGTITMRLPNGNTMTLQHQFGAYFLSGSDAQGSQSPLFIPQAGGQFTFTNTGGADVGVFSGAQITMPPQLIWTNMNAINTVVRSQGVTVNWDKSTPYDGTVTISGSSFNINGTDTSNAIVTGFTCTAPYSAGTFTVPSYILLVLVPGQGSVGGIAIPTGSLSLALTAPPVRFTAPTIDYAIIDAYSGTGKSVTYQ